MLVLALLILAAFVTGLIFSEGFNSTDKSIRESLDVQLDVFEKEVTSHYDSIAAAGIGMSETLTGMLEEYMDERGISFHELQDSSNDIGELQNSFIDLLYQRIFQEDCSGIFVMLDTTVNSAVENAEHSRTGVYLKLHGYNTSNRNVVLYRGESDTAKDHGIMPHRKWRLEFRCDLIPDYKDIRACVGDLVDSSYRFSQIFTLPGTSDNVMLLTVPIIGSDGSFYGICGLEISQNYFMSYHAQPSNISHLTCMVATSEDAPYDSSAVFSCGVLNGYYRVPTGTITQKNSGSNMTSYADEGISYIGLNKSISVSPNNGNHTLIVTMPKHDYDVIVGKSIAKTVVLWLLLIFFTVNCCFFFSRRFLSPILKGIEELKSSKAGRSSTSVPEIDDLFLFLAEKDREHEAALLDLANEIDVAEAEKERLRIEYEQAQKRFEAAQAEVSRLAYSRKKEVDPDDYTRFLEGIKTLTPTEKKIFEYYLEGKSVKEITEIASIKESTLRYHNQNIYGKLGVNSLKELLRYAALMKEEK